MASEIHKDDIGTRFLLTVKDGSDFVNISGATALQVDFIRDIQRVLDLYRGLEYHSHCIKGIPYKNKP